MLTDAKIRAAKPAEKSYRLPDTGGLFVFITTAGHKIWRLRYKIHGVEKTYVLGEYPDLSLSEARLEECCHIEYLPLPKGANKQWLSENFSQLRTALSRCRWLGPGRGWIDPVAERQGSVLVMDAGLSTLENEVAENAGEDWEEVVHQRAVEVKRFDELGLERPEWAGSDQTATQAATPPKIPDAT